MQAPALLPTPGSVVVAVEPDKEPLGPLHLGGLLARLTGGPLILVTVFELHPALDGPEDAGQREIRAAAREDLAALGRTLEGVEVADALVLAGSSAGRELQVLSESAHAALVVIGSTTRGALRQVLPGSIAERLLSGAASPVAVAPHGYGDGPASTPGLVGVGFDGSDESRLALALARDLALSAGARLRIVSVLEPGLRELHEAALAEDAGVETEGVLLEGDAAEILAAQSREVGLMVVGSRGYGPVGAVLLGGTSHPLLREAACPLIVTPRAHPDA